MLDLVSLFHRSVHFIFQSIFCLLFRMSKFYSKFYWSFFKYTDSILCHLQSTEESIQESF